MKSLLFLIFLAGPLLSISQSDSTIIAPTMYSEVTGERNVIYCSSLEILWLKLTDYLGEQPKTEEEQLEVTNLNKVITNYETPIEQKYWLAHIGLIKEGAVDSITKYYKHKFGLNWIPKPYQTDDLIGHSFLKKNIDFYSRLDDDFYDFKFKDSIQVRCFGLEGGWANPTFKKQLKIHDYINEDNFIFQMGCKDSLDEIYFAKVPSNGNLMDTYNSVMNRVSKDNIQFIGNYDHLKIPYLNFDIVKDFENLKNVRLSNPDYSKLIFKELSQNIAFDLNKDGVRIESTTDLVIMEFGYNDVIPKVYAFDQPFLIIVKRKGRKMPYFLYWVQNSEHMELTN